MKKLLILALLASVCLFQTGCGSTFFYENAELYSVGGNTLTEQVENLDVSWVSGKVFVKYHDENTVIFSETANKTLTDPMTLHYYLDGKTLRLRYSASGTIYFGNLHKTLTVTLPRTKLKSILIESVSANVDLEKGEADSLHLDLVSGNYTGDFTVTNEFSANTVSGDISGHITCASLQAESVSGNISLTTTNLDRFDISTVSGDVSFELQSATQGELEAVSGGLTLIMPELLGFTLSFDKVSGDLESDFATTQTNGKYIYGDGAMKLSVDTVSGSLKLKKAN